MRVILTDHGPQTDLCLQVSLRATKPEYEMTEQISGGLNKRKLKLVTQCTWGFYTELLDSFYHYLLTQLVQQIKLMRNLYFIIIDFQKDKRPPQYSM